MKYFIFLLFIIITNICAYYKPIFKKNYFKKNVKVCCDDSEYNQTNQNLKKNIDLLSYFEINNESKLQVIGTFNKIDLNKFYFIIGNNNINYYNLKNDMIRLGYNGIFSPYEYYKKNNLNDLIDLTKLSIDDIDKIINNNNNFLIFNNDKYIGGLFDIYEIIDNKL